MFTIAAGTLFTIVGTCTAEYTDTDFDGLPGIQVSTIGSGQVYSTKEIQVEAGGEPPSPSESRVDTLEDGKRVFLYAGAVLETEAGDGTLRRVTLKMGEFFRVHGSLPVVRWLQVL